jgi:hypothetical protein
MAILTNVLPAQTFQSVMTAGGLGNDIGQNIEVDQDGNILWDFHDWQTYTRFSIGNLHLRENGDLIVYGKGIHTDETINIFFKRAFGNTAIGFFCNNPLA